MRFRKLAAGAAVIATVFGLSACGQSDADVASKNLSKDAEQFKIERRVVFYNGITDVAVLEIRGLCSVEDYVSAFEVTCKDDKGYKKHFLGRSDNLTYFAQQLESADVSTSRYKVIWKPSTLIPDLDIK